VEKETIIRQGWALFEPCLATHGYDLVEVEYGVQYGRNVLRIFIDKEPNGVTLDDCAAVSQLLGPMLDKNELFPGRYVLEVSSPGIDRPVRKPSDFHRFTGESIRIVTHAPVNGRKKFTGSLQGFQKDTILLECDGMSYEIPLGNVKKANLNR